MIGSSAVAAGLLAGAATVASDGRYLLDVLNRYVFPQGPAIVTDRRHQAWRRVTREAVPRLRDELARWEAAGHCFPEFTSLTPAAYFPEADAATYGRPQRRTWGFLWLRLYGRETKLAQAFPELRTLYDSLPGGMQIYSLGLSLLQPGRGDVTHFGEFRGSWRQLLTLETGGEEHEQTVLGLYPYGDGACDSIWTPPDRFQAECRAAGRMRPPALHRYREARDLLFDDTVWHFVDNRSERRRVAVWVDVLRDDLSWAQWLALRAFMMLAHVANDEVAETVRLVDGLDYRAQCGAQAGARLDSAPRGPEEEYDRTLLLEDDLDGG